MSDTQESPMTVSVLQSGGVVAHRLVKAETADPKVVEYCTTADESNAIGVTVRDANTTEKVAIKDLKSPGTTKVTAGAAIAVGDQLACGLTGKVITRTTEQWSLGIAWEAATADGDVIEALLQKPGVAIDIGS